MQNTDLFNFMFVDRQTERSCVKNFISSNLDSPHVLWMHGESGVGKTELINWVKNILPVYRYVHVNPMQADNTKYIEIFMRELESRRESSLSDYIFQNYKSFLDITRKVIDISALNTASKISIELILSGVSLLVDKKNNDHSISSVLVQYLKTDIGNHSIVIILDNFQKCDDYSLELIAGIIDDLLPNKNIRFIVITTEDYTDVSDSTIRFLAEKVPYKKMDIHPFDNVDYFGDILSEKFMLENISLTKMNQLFRMCSGVPEKLKIFLINLIKANGIECFEENECIFRPNCTLIPITTA